MLQNNQNFWFYRFKEMSNLNLIYHSGTETLVIHLENLDFLFFLWTKPKWYSNWPLLTWQGTSNVKSCHSGHHLMMLLFMSMARCAPSYTPFALCLSGWLSPIKVECGPSEKSPFHKKWEKNCIRKNCFVCDNEKQVTQSKYFLSMHYTFNMNAVSLLI